MTLAELKTRLSTTGYSVAYRSFPEGSAPALPFVVYLETGTRNMGADGGVFYKARHIAVELYTKVKDETAEAAVENALSGIYFTKTEAFLDDEKCYEIIYEIEV